MYKFAMKYRFAFIIIIGIVVNSLLFFKYGEHIVRGDAVKYQNVALKILQGGNLSSENPYKLRDIGSVGTPGYPAIIAVIYFIFGINPEFVYLFQVIISLLSLLLIQKLLEKVTNPSVSFVSVVWLALYTKLWSWNFFLMMEIVSTVLICIVLWEIFQSLKTKKTVSLFWFSAFFGILTFINVRFFFHFFFLLGFWILLKVIKINAFLSIKQLLLILAFFLAILLPWHIRQYVIYEKPVFFTPGTASEKFYASPEKLPPYEQYMKFIEDDLDAKPVMQKNFMKHFNVEQYNRLASEYQSRTGLMIYFSRFTEFFRIFSFNMYLNPGKDYRINPPFSLIKNVSEGIFWIPVFLFSFLGFIFAIRKLDIFILSCSALFFAHVVFHTLIHYIPRYRVTIIPVLVIIAGYGLYMIIQIIWNSRSAKITRVFRNSSIKENSRVNE